MCHVKMKTEMTALCCSSFLSFLWVFLKKERVRHWKREIRTPLGKRLEDGRTSSLLSAVVDAGLTGSGAALCAAAGVGLSVDLSKDVGQRETSPPCGREVVGKWQEAEEDAVEPSFGSLKLGRQIQILWRAGFLSNSSRNKGKNSCLGMR